ncbi:MAG: hypothetical protein EXS36_11635 [Pedosphaera sp.]|nr:hypothetical protein [Pedosphaera sp.]
MYIDSGTSFSAPSVAGVAATLREASPGSTARQVRNALIQTANPPLDPGSFRPHGPGPWLRGCRSSAGTPAVGRRFGRAWPSRR